MTKDDIIPFFTPPHLEQHIDQLSKSCASLQLSARIQKLVEKAIIKTFSPDIRELEDLCSLMQTHLFA